MSSLYPPMPNLTTDEEDTRTTASLCGSSNNGFHPDSPSQEMSIVTKTTSQTHCINWEIDIKSLHIARLAGKGERRGVIEACVEKEGTEFKLELCASGWRNSQDGYSAFYLTVKDEGESFVGRYRVNVGDITRISSIRHDFHLGVGFPNFCAQTSLDALVSDKNLKFQVSVEAFRSQSRVVQTHNLEMRDPGRLTYLTNLLEGIHSHRLHTDVVLVCQGHRIPAHKAFLSSASPVFRAMFSRPFLESSLREVSLDRFPPQTVEAMVRFLYTAKLECESGDTTNKRDDENSSELMNCGLDEPESTLSEAVGFGKEEAAMKDWSDDPRIFNLFQFAEMYKMTSLVIACCQKMYSMICVENTCEFLVRLDRYSHVPEIGEIQESVWDFVKENYREIKNTPGFAKMVERHPNVVAQLMDKLL